MDRPFPLQQQWIDHIDTRYWRPEFGRLWRNVAIGVIPVVLLAVAFAWAKPSAKPAAVATPVQRGDKFEQRFPNDIGPVVRAVRTISIVPPPSEPQPLPAAPALVAAVDDAPTPRARPEIEVDRPLKRSRARYRAGDVCQQHGKKKVMVGRYRWRCR
jgi:hypothetical protein